MGGNREKKKKTPQLVDPYVDKKRIKEVFVGREAFDSQKSATLAIVATPSWPTAVAHVAGWGPYKSVRSSSFPGLDLHYADLGQPLTTTGEELDDLDRDLSDLSVRGTNEWQGTLDLYKHRFPQTRRLVQKELARDTWRRVKKTKTSAKWNFSRKTPKSRRIRTSDRQIREILI